MKTLVGDPWKGKIRVGSPRRIRHGDTLDVIGVRIIFVKPGRECEVRGQETTVEISGRAPEVAARVASKLRAFGIDARRSGRTIILKRDSSTIYAGEKRLPVIVEPRAIFKPSDGPADTLP